MTGSKYGGEGVVAGLQATLRGERERGAGGRKEWVCLLDKVLGVDTWPPGETGRVQAAPSL